MREANLLDDGQVQMGPGPASSRSVFAIRLEPVVCRPLPIFSCWLQPACWALFYADPPVFRFMLHDCRLPYD